MDGNNNNSYGSNVYSREIAIMGNITTALVIVLAVNVFLFLGQHAVLQIEPLTGSQFFDAQGSIICSFETGECANTSTYLLDDIDPSTGLPTDESVTTDTGNIFTDTFNAAKDWITRTTGLDYLNSMISAPSNFLKAIGTPGPIAFALGAFWYGVTLFLVITWLLGRND